MPVSWPHGYAIEAGFSTGEPSFGHRGAAQFCVKPRKLALCAACLRQPATPERLAARDVLPAQQNGGEP